MKALQVRGLAVGEGRPKICVSFTAADVQGLLKEAAQAATGAADMAEWRADYFEGPLEEGTVTSALRMLRATLGEMPLVFTLHTPGEGGVRPVKAGEYKEAVLAAVACGQADIVDVELSAGSKTVRQLVEAAQKAEVKTIISHHVFEETPGKDEMVDCLRKLRSLGADIPKLAVMPKTPADTLALLAACEEYARLFAEGPFVGIAMGRLGAVSRVAAGAFGSAITFSYAGGPSAAGQMPAAELAAMLDALYGK